MLKVSGLFILLCGLLASSSAQEVLSSASLQITDALTKGLLGTNVLSALQTIDFQGSLNNVFGLASGSQNILGGLLTNSDANFVVQITDFRLLQVSLENSPDFKGAELRVPLAFSIQIKLPALNSYVFNVRTDTRVQLSLEKGVDGKYRLAFGHCRIAPDAVWIQSENLFTPLKNIVENIERVLRNLIINDLGAKICPFINSFLYNLTPQVTNELISLLLPQGRFQGTI